MANSPPARPGSRESAPDGTRARILQSGMRNFAREGYGGATTRMIAASAGVTLPVIAYHFGNKEGLHRATAEAIVESYREHMLPLVRAAREAVDTGSLSAADARNWLQQVIDSLVAAIAARPEERLATDFVLRELGEPGPGYALLLRELWRPGILLVADLLARARGNRATGDEERAGALMLLASLSAFTTLSPVAQAVTGWEDIAESRRATIATLARQLLEGLLAAAN